MEKNRAIILAIVAVIIILLLKTQPFWIKFNPETSIADLSSLLMSFAIIATLIERFLDRGPLQSGYQFYKENRQLKLTEPENTDVQKILAYKAKFNWTAFALGVIIACFGFKFFVNITTTECLRTIDCNSEVWAGKFKFFNNYAYPIVDIFLTGILLSSGAQFIREIVKMINNFLNPPNDLTTKAIAEVKT